ILVTGYHRKDYVLRAVELEASALIFKGGSGTRLLPLALETALNGVGEMVMSPDALTLLVQEYHRLVIAQSTEGLLTPREGRVAKLVARGMTSQAIADQMHLSVRTIENV